MVTRLVQIAGLIPIAVPVAIPIAITCLLGLVNRRAHSLSLVAESGFLGTDSPLAVGRGGCPRYGIPDITAGMAVSLPLARIVAPAPIPHGLIIATPLGLASTSTAGLRTAAPAVAASASTASIRTPAPAVSTTRTTAGTTPRTAAISTTAAAIPAALRDSDSNITDAEGKVKVSKEWDGQEPYNHHNKASQCHFHFLFLRWDFFSTCFVGTFEISRPDRHSLRSALAPAVLERSKANARILLVKFAVCRHSLETDVPLLFQYIRQCSFPDRTLAEKPSPFGSLSFSGGHLPSVAI